MVWGGFETETKGYCFAKQLLLTLYLLKWYIISFPLLRAQRLFFVVILWLCYSFMSLNHVSFLQKLILIMLSCCLWGVLIRYLLYHYIWFKFMYTDWMDYILQKNLINFSVSLMFGLFVLYIITYEILFYQYRIKTKY